MSFIILYFVLWDIKNLIGVGAYKFNKLTIGIHVSLTCQNLKLKHVYTFSSTGKFSLVHSNKQYLFKENFVIVRFFLSNITTKLVLLAIMNTKVKQ